MKKGGILAFECGKVLVITWKDKKKVANFKTLHNAEMREICKKIRIKDTFAVTNYNDTRGVDRTYQQLNILLHRKETNNIIRKLPLLLSI